LPSCISCDALWPRSLWSATQAGHSKSGHSTMPRGVVGRRSVPRPAADAWAASAVALDGDGNAWVASGLHALGGLTRIGLPENEACREDSAGLVDTSTGPEDVLVGRLGIAPQSSVRLTRSAGVPVWLSVASVGGYEGKIHCKTSRLFLVEIVLSSRHVPLSFLPVSPSRRFCFAQRQGGSCHHRDRAGTTNREGFSSLRVWKHA
jgi:hypothetical protein